MRDEPTDAGRRDWKSKDVARFVPRMNDLGIIVLGFARPDHLRAVLESLRRQDALRLTEIWLDGHAGRTELHNAVESTRRVAREFIATGYHFQSGHLGVEKVMLDALDHGARRYRRLIIIEDDCFPARDAVATFDQELALIERRGDVFSVYGHHFLVPAEGETITRFQGWGWGVWSFRLAPLLVRLRTMAATPERDYLDYVNTQLTSDVRARLDVTPGRNVVDTLQRMFSWDSALALLTAQDGLVHKRTPRQVVFNFGLDDATGHFAVDGRFRAPPFNIVDPTTIWERF
jgi:hypothetical protein